MEKTLKQQWDVCIVGSGAGAGPVIYELSKAGFKVLVLEKGPWFRTGDFSKDEMVAARRSVYTPRLQDERHVLEYTNEEGNLEAKSTYDSGRDFWNGNCVGGSSNFMSGYFQRLKPQDFRLLSEYGAIEGANVVDWPISYEDLEPYYTKVEQIVGVSGRLIDHPFQEPRSTDDFPYPPLAENVVSSWLDKAAESLGYPLVPLPRAILSQPSGERHACVYSNYCGSYGCSSDAKGSARVALIHKALKTGNCTVIPNAKVYHLETNGKQKIVRAWFYDAKGQKQKAEAGIFVVAAQAVETSRLLLMSKNPGFPDGLANHNGQVGKNLIFSAGGTGGGDFFLAELPEKEAKQLSVPGLFVNRSLHQYYEYRDEKTGQRMKGGTVDFLFEHANPVSKAMHRKWDDEGNLRYGAALKEDLKNYFRKVRKLKFEIFNDWLPTDGCFVRLDPKVKDKWGDPVARIRIDYHPHDLEVGEFLAGQAKKIMEATGAKNIYANVSGSPPPNLQAGGCRFGHDAETSVLDPDCKAHSVDNLYITDGSFMPTGGSVTYTWTIYANAFRVAEKIIERLRK